MRTESKDERVKRDGRARMMMKKIEPERRSS